MKTIKYPDFEKVIICTGTILKCNPNVKARKPAYIFEIDFGSKWGKKTSSAQLTDNYLPEDLIGKQIVAVMNFEPKRIAGIKSEVLILGVSNQYNSIVLLHPERKVENGVIVC